MFEANWPLCAQLSGGAYLEEFEQQADTATKLQRTMYWCVAQYHEAVLARDVNAHVLVHPATFLLWVWSHAGAGSVSAPLARSWTIRCCSRPRSMFASLTVMAQAALKSKEESARVADRQRAAG